MYILLTFKVASVSTSFIKANSYSSFNAFLSRIRKWLATSAHLIFIMLKHNCGEVKFKSNDETINYSTL